MSNDNRDQFYEDFNKSIRLINPYIQIISISKYTEESNGSFKDLPGCNIDRKNMIDLGKHIYKFDENRLFYNDESGIIFNKQQLNGILLTLKAKMTLDNINNNNNKGEYNRYSLQYLIVMSITCTFESDCIYFSALYINLQF